MQPAPVLTPALRRQIVDTVRMLAADGVEKANSGHPGAPMGQADIAFVLWHEFMRFDPALPAWWARDRFVLSCGHASMLLYPMLHLWGYDVSMEDLQSFRQWNSITPGHPEVGLTPGVETTTGPLGQGVANSVGMALAARMLSARVSTEDFNVMPQRIFALCSDGDLMEGISQEAAALAGHWKLNNLVWLYDDNGITIDGDTSLAWSEDTEGRFEALGWQVLHADGHDHDELRTALKQAVRERERPTLVICRTHIGFGAPTKQDTAGAHGAPLGAKELAATKEKLGWPQSPTFLVPDDVRAFFAAARAEKQHARAAWEAGYQDWRKRNPERAELLDTLMLDEAPADLRDALLSGTPVAGPTRKLSGAAIAAAAAKMPGLIGGSADLTESNNTAMEHAGVFGAPDAGAPHGPSFTGRQMHYGIREHAMGSINNGVLLHGGLRPFGGTFLVFSDYMRPAIRLAALSHLRNVFVFTHDSVFLGEDGPTHQPIEHLWALRMIPGLVDFRPADGVEVAMAWAYALEHAKGPTFMALTRQALPAIARHEGFEAEDVWRGGYVVSDAPAPEVVLVGTGSELQLCVAAAAKLTLEGRRVRVVSMPSWALFCKQSHEYREKVVASGHPRICTIEAGLSTPWRALTGLTGLNLGIDRFGASAPANVLAEKFGLTVEAVNARIKAWL
ncbi:MAG: transketolase [Bradymonadia bacterium]